jgi:FkbM family methyltransferase
MSIRHDVAGFSKTLNRGAVGRRVTFAAKFAAGCYFDLFCGQYRTNGLTFEIPLKHTTRAMRGRFAADTYELPERQLILKHLAPDSHVLELGGCIGVVSCLVNSLLTDRHAHIVVEANPFLIPFLERNRDVNGAKFSVEHCVVTRATEAILSLAADMDSSKAGDHGLTVPTLTCENIEARYQLSFDTLVMDIEGAESEFIKENRLLFQKVKLIVVEFHPSIRGVAETEGLRKLLVEYGLTKVDHKLTTEVYRRV